MVDGDDGDGAKRAAARALSLLDLTNLGDACDAAQVATLCARAQSPHGDVAAVCLFPRFVAQARALLGVGHPVKIATVVDFPGGGATVETAVDEAGTAVAAGADEIDLVMPYRRLIAGDRAAVSAMVEAVRAAVPDVLLKVILETGELKDPALVRLACDLAIGAGADFLKTSTGKVAVNATPEAAEILLEAIRRSPRPVGFKAAGGIGSVAVATRYLALAEDVMGPGWPTPTSFRLGASGLLDDILAVLDGRARVVPSSGY